MGQIQSRNKFILRENESTEYLNIEGEGKAGLRPDDGEDLALMKRAPRILLSSGVQIPQPSCQGEVATVNNAHCSPSYTFSPLRQGFSV